MQNKIMQLLTVFIIFSACKNEESKSTLKTDKQENIEELFALMQGSFNSEIQSKVDSSYYNISLHMYPIWEKQGYYLYVEQALNSMQDKPYRQRIYKLNKINDSVFSSEVYEMKNDSLWIGKWKNPKAFDSLTLEEISLKSGCEVILKRISEKYYRGKTGDTTCRSSLRGAAFARSEVEILEDKIISWDRGFDSIGNYVWGAEKGGYIFNKLD